MGIKREIRWETSGNENSFSQAFYNNLIITQDSPNTTFFTFDVPQYTTWGGVPVNEYYQQSPYSVFTNLAKPFIRYTFSANAESFGVDTEIVHDIYKLDFKTFSEYNTDITKVPEKQNFVNRTENIVEETEDSDGVRLTKTTKRTFGSTEDSREFLQENFVTTLGFIQEKVGEPIISLTANTSGITTNVYDLILEQDVKKLGRFTEELFEDRSQYFVNTFFRFKRERNPNLNGFWIEDVNSPGSLINVGYKKTVFEQTSIPIHTVSTGKYTGVRVVGNYFTYFKVPDKPKFLTPIPSGVLDTFAPKFFWDDDEDIDSYLFQVTYMSGDTGFTETIFSYPIEKNEENLRNGSFTDKSVSTEDVLSEKAIRFSSVPLKSDSCFRIRLGAVKKLANIFGVNQEVVTFSDSIVACTQPEAVKTYVRVRSDSPYTETVPEYEVPPSLDSENSLADYSLSGVVSGSVISNAYVKLTAPNSNFITQLTNAQGEFFFNELEEGDYVLEITKGGYGLVTKNININQNTLILINLPIVWGNDFITWGDKSDEIPII